MDDYTAGYLADQHTAKGVSDCLRVGFRAAAYPAEAIERRTLYWLPLSSRASLRPATYCTFSQSHCTGFFGGLTYALAKACLSAILVSEDRHGCYNEETYQDD